MRLPILSYRDLVRILLKQGFKEAGQRGSHMKYKKQVDGKIRTVFVPRYDEIGHMVLLSIIRQMGLTREEFLEILKKL